MTTQSRSPAPTTAVLSAILEAGNGLLQTKYTFVAAYAAAIYDHFITLDIEIEHIWLRRISLVTILFFLTRYYFIFALTISWFVFYQPVVNIKICERILLFIPVGAGAVLTALPNLIVMLRIYALYERNFKLALVLLVCIAAQAGLGLWVDLTPSIKRLDTFLALGYPELDDLPTLRSCVPQLSPKLTKVEPALGQILQSIFDTVAVALILFKARQFSSGSGIVAVIAKQGLAYYILNVCTYLTWTFMLFFAPTESIQLLSGPALGLLCISVNRLTLHLRSYPANPFIDSAESSRSLAFVTDRLSKRRRRSSWLGSSTLQAVDNVDDVKQEVHEMRVMTTQQEAPETQVTQL